MFVVFSGPSGSGKNSVIKKLIEKHPDWEFVKSVTTRPPRGEGLHLHMTNEEFLKAACEGKFFESEPMHGDFWVGILKDSIEKIENSPKKMFLKDVDVKGTDKLRTHFEGKNLLLTIFIDTPNEELAVRLKKRGESDERIAVRLSRSEMERSFAPKYDFVVQNVELEETVAQIEKIIEERRR